MDYRVTVETVPQQLLAAARQRTTYASVGREIQDLLSRPWAFLGAHPGLRTDGHNVAIYWRTPDDEASEAIEVGVQVIARFEETADVVCSATPGWELYGDWEEDPAKLRTDVFYLLKE